MKIIITVFLLISTTAHAFNWSRCSNSQPVTAQGGSLWEFLSAQGSNTSVSSTQGISSWGDCSLIGKAETVKKTFIAQNLPFLQQEMAKGSGEYLMAYARIHQCSPEGQKQFAREMKKHYFEVDRRKEAMDFEGVFQVMEAPFEDLRTYCPLT